MRSLHLTTALLTFTILFSSCKKDEDPPAPSGGGGGGGGVAQVQFSINGDGFSNQTITIDPMAGSGNALYSTADAETSGIVMADADNQFQLLFPGNIIGTYTCSGGVGDVGIGLRINGQQYINNTNTVEITAYGAVGGWIQGTWTGTVQRANGPSAGTQATITNGTFKFKRMGDV